MTPKVRDEAACILLAAADLWRQRICPAGEAAQAIGSASCAVVNAVNDAVAALWTPHRHGIAIVRGVRCNPIVDYDMVWQEAAGLLLDGWNPGEGVRLPRGCS